ncbi:unnamed protein product [Caenorhabditis angaria]|uniref:AP-3 complex subunit beta n=1 Tax=Caenorhabditis angaria TaxID=860376 RepID=A0A9P1I6G5_9PELO|nr:unnamed protein product [Caenorhabditis angaria]
MTAFVEGLASPEMEIAEGGVILDNRARFSDLKAMLDSNKDNLKVDAMKRIINLIAKGKDVSDLFPAVVKNVAAKNVELKKLVFVYLVRYAEEQQDLALLSISTFQRALKDPNQLIRGSALRVLTSIRVPMVAPIMLLAIKDAVRDMSPYVRKVAAHAIPKLYSLEPDLEAQLVDCIDFLLADRRSLVLGSAVYAFDEICPDRLDLLHKHFRALCRGLADVDEWGQIVMINMLTRYARTELANPDKGAPDTDIVLLLNSARPLLQSRNCGVVMAVTQLFYHVAPKAQLSQIARALVRLLRGPREVQYVVLMNIATICERNPVEEGTFAISKTMFDPFLKSFFVRSCDSSLVKQLKLHVLTSLVSESNVHIILRELQTYVQMSDLASAAVEAIGRCAIRVGAVSEQCMTGLVTLISSSDEKVVCSAVVVIKRLLHADAPVSLLARLMRLMPRMVAAQARACVVWLVATHVEQVVHLAPDLLRQIAKKFPTEDEMVKLESLKLAVKLWMIRRSECEKMVQYVFQLARFDLSYDVRDRCRFLRNLMFNTKILAEHADEIFMAKKPAPALVSSFKERDQFQLGSLSHVLNQRCTKYLDLPEFPELSSDPSLRKEPTAPNELNLEEEEEEEDEEEDEESGEEEEESEDDDEEENQEESEEEENSDEDEEESEEEENSDEEEESEDESEDSEAPPPPPKIAKNSKKLVENGKSKPDSSEANIDLLIDVDFSAAGSRQIVEPEFVETSETEILNVIEGQGISLSIQYPRTNDGQYTPIRFILINKTDKDIENVEILNNDSQLDVKGNTKISLLPAGARISQNILIDLQDSATSREWILQSPSPTVIQKSFRLQIPYTEQIQPVRLNLSELEKEHSRLGGLNRNLVDAPNPVNVGDIVKCANLCKIDENIFVAQTRSRKDICIIKLLENGKIEASCDNAVIGRIVAFQISKNA